MLLLSCGMNGERRRGTEAKENCKSLQESNSTQGVLSSHWERFDFTDTSLIHKPQITERLFAEFALQLPHTPDTLRRTAIERLLTRAQRGGTAMVGHFMELASKWLNDPNSPYRDEESYIPFLQYAVMDSTLPHYMKERFQFEMEKALMNRKGSIAADFHFITEDGATGTLHGHSRQYILLYFFNPGCHDCNRVKEYIHHSTLLNNLVQSGRLLILAVYPDEILDEWNIHKGENPSNWITVRMASQADRERYWLPAIPNLYLLNSAKRVLLKDAPVEAIESYLATRSLLPNR